MGWRDRLPFTPTIAQGTPNLLSALGVCHAYARRESGSAPWLALPDILRGLGVTQSVLPCLVEGAKAFRWRATLNDEILRPVLRALSRAAETGLERLTAMEADHRRAVSALREEYRSTSLGRLAALIMSRPLLSPQSTAQDLGLTPGGAGKLLTRAASFGMVVEVTGRRAWRLYLVPDLAAAFGFQAPPRGRPPKVNIAPIPDRSMANALDAFDREMAAFDDRFGRID